MKRRLTRIIILILIVVGLLHLAAFLRGFLATNINLKSIKIMAHKYQYQLHIRKLNDYTPTTSKEKIILPDEEIEKNLSENQLELKEFSQENQKKILDLLKKHVDKSLNELSVQESIVVSANVTGGIFSYDFKALLEFMFSKKRPRFNYLGSITEDPNLLLSERKVVCSQYSFFHIAVFNLLKRYNANLKNTYLTEVFGYLQPFVFFQGYSYPKRPHYWIRIATYISENEVMITYVDPTLHDNIGRLDANNQMHELVSGKGINKGIE